MGCATTSTFGRSDAGRSIAVRTPWWWSPVRSRAPFRSPCWQTSRRTERTRPSRRSLRPSCRTDRSTRSTRRPRPTSRSNGAPRKSQQRADLSLARRRYRSQTRRRPWQTLLRTSGIESSSPQGVRDTRRRPLHHRRLDLRHRRCRLGQPHHPCRLSLPPLLYRPRRRLRRRRSRRARRPVQTILVKARA